MEKTEDNDKKTITTIETLLSGKDLRTFKTAQKTWLSIPTTSMALLAKMDKVGVALNLLYRKGDEKKLKKEAITDMARLAFPSLHRRERSEYRKLANNYTAIKLFTEFAGIKSGNPTYLVNAWAKAVKEDQESMELVRLERQGGLDAQGQVMKDKDSNTSLGLVKESKVQPTISKTGLTPLIRNTGLTPSEVTTQVGYILNQVKTLFNEGKLNADQLTTIEGHITSTIQHINSVDNPVALAV